MAAAVGAVIVLGLVRMLLERNRRGRLAVAFIVVGAILAAGTQGPFGWLYQWAFDTVPLFTTMREPARIQRPASGARPSPWRIRPGVAIWTTLWGTSRSISLRMCRAMLSA